MRGFKDLQIEFKRIYDLEIKFSKQLYIILNKDMLTEDTARPALL